MQNAAAIMAKSSEGFLLLDDAMSPIFVNPAAAQILAYPENPERLKNLSTYLANRIRSTLFSERPNGTPLVATFLSGRRTYNCRGFPGHGMANGAVRSYFAVLLERRSPRTAPRVRLSEKFHLTNREQEVTEFLLQGLTSKEIGVQMQISPNTVKTYLRLIMVKMDASTRSGVVGKALSTEM